MMRRFPSRPSARHVRGQALVLALVLLFVGSLGLLFMFSAGQTSATKQRVVNAADAAAYSAAVWRARTLNYQAYANRAIIAQEVAIAQAVTLTSWSKYFETFIENVTTVVEIVFPVAAPVIEQIQQIIGYLQDATEYAARLEVWLRGAEGVGYKNLLASSQELMHQAGGPFGVSAIALEVAHLNDPSFFGYALSDDGAYAQLTREYASDPDRRRLHGLVIDSLDPFVTSRGADLPLTPIVCGVLMVRKRGGTAMAPDLERWEAADTLSLHGARVGGRGCATRELVPIGWGAAEASTQNTGRISSNPGDVEVNADALEEAVEDIVSFDSYSGITRVRELNYEALDNPRYPTSPIAVLVRAPIGSARTSSVIGAGVGRLQLRENLHRDHISAVAAADVYFRRPADAPARVEYASLYSPYWQARLREPTQAQRAEAQGDASR